MTDRKKNYLFGVSENLSTVTFSDDQCKMYDVVSSTTIKRAYQEGKCCYILYLKYAWFVLDKYRCSDVCSTFSDEAQTETSFH